MSLDEYIANLEELRRQEGGDLLVQTHNYKGERENAPAPKLAHMRILQGRERTERFWDRDGDHCKGAKVVRV